MAATKTMKLDATPGVEIVQDLLYAGIGAAAVAGDGVGATLGCLSARGRKFGQQVSERFEDASEELGEVVSERIPEAVAEPLERARERIEETCEESSEEIRRRLFAAARLLGKGGKKGLELAGKPVYKLFKLFGKGVEPLASGMGLATSKDMKRIEKRLDALDRKLDALEKRA